MGMIRNPVGVTPSPRSVRQLLRWAGWSTRWLAFVLFLLFGATPELASGQPCGQVPTCNGPCDPGATCTFSGAAGCICVAQPCGDWPSCTDSNCPPQSVCSDTGLQTCVCLALPTPTPTITPTATATGTPNPQPVPAASSGGLLLALVALAVIGIASVAQRRLRSRAE